MSVNRSRLLLAVAFGAVMVLACQLAMTMTFGNTEVWNVSWIIMKPANFLMTLVGMIQGKALSHSQLALVGPLGLLLSVACWTTVFYVLFWIRDFTVTRTQK
jgi:hypothetical protein